MPRRKALKNHHIIAYDLEGDLSQFVFGLLVRINPGFCVKEDEPCN